MNDGRTGASRRGRRGGRPFRGAALPATLMSLAVLVGRLCADDDMGQPSLNAQDWPRGEWTAVPRDLLLDFLSEQRGGHELTLDAAPYIERIVYRGELRDDLSFSGGFDAAIQSDSDPVLELRHVSMFLGDLNWEDRPAEWGTAEDGRSVLVVPEGASFLQGRWSLAHRVVGQRVEFRVQAPPAAATRFELSLPAEWTLSSSIGAVLPPDLSESGSRTWVVELGRRHECLWTLERADAPELSPLMLAERSLVYSVGADHCQIHAEFDARVLRGPVHELRFVLPPGFQYTRTTYAGNIPLVARLEEDQGTQVLVVPVPELSPGLLEKVEIDGTLPSILDDLWSLPELSLQGARMMRGTRRLRVEVPLAVSVMEPADLRQSDAALSASGVDWFFEELNDESDLTVRLAVRKPRIAARVASRVDDRLGGLQCDAVVRLHTQSGTWYAADFRLPRDWEVFDVVPAAGAPDSGVSYWSVAPEDGEQRLHVEFRQAASLLSPRSILIRSRAGGSGSAGESFSAPVPVPVETDDCRVLLVVDADWSLGRGPTEELAWAESRRSAINSAWSAELDALDVSVANERELRLFESLRTFETASWRIQRSVEPETQEVGRIPSPTTGMTAEAADGRRQPSLALTLQSRLASDPADADWHEAVFDVVAGQCGDSLSFSLPTEFSLRAVLANGKPAVYSRQGERIELAELTSDVRDVEIHYSHPGAAGGGGWMSQRGLTVVPPAGDQKVVGFRWEVRLPRRYGIARDPSWPFVSSQETGLSIADRMLGPFFRAQSETDLSRDAGFGHVTFAAPSAPDSLSLQVWNSDVVRTYAWVAFLGAVLLLLLARRIGMRRWFPVALAAISVSAVLAAALATVPAQLCGSVFLGLVVAVLVPRRLTGMRTPGETDSAEAGRVPSRNSAAWSAVSLVIVLSLLAASLCAADDEPVPADLETTGAGRARMLIPHANAGPARTAYVNPDLARELAEWQAARDTIPRFLLRSARYSVAADPEQRVRAEIDVLVRSGLERVAVRLPFAGVTFRSSQDCLVDGVPAPLRPATDGTGMIVEVLSDRSGTDAAGAAEMPYRGVTITLTFRPRISESGTEREAKLPQIIDSRLTLERSGAGSEPPGIFRAGALREDAAGWEAELGPVGELGVNSGAPQSPATPPPPPSLPATPQSGKAVSLIEIRPGNAWVRTRLELRHAPRAFEPDSTAPQVIELAGLCDVREVKAANLESFHVRYRDPERTIVELVFNQPESAESVVHLDYARPPSSDGQWRFPDVITVDDAPLSEHLVGITSSRGFRIDADSSVADAAGVRVIAPETFIERVSEESGWRAPDIAWLLTPSVNLPVRIDRLEAERSTGIEQTLSVGDDRTAWRAEMSMNVVGALATQHRITLSPSVQVESVSVLQDGAERVLSWSQDDEGLVVFLSGVRTGVQEILLQGHCVAADGALQEVPVLRVPGATVGKSETVIENQGRHMVELLDSRGLLTGVLTPLNEDQGAAQASSSRFDSDDPNAPSEYRVQSRRSGLSLEVLVAVSPTRMAVGFRPQTSTTAVHEWELAIPGEWGDDFVIEPASALVGRQARPAGGWDLKLRTGNSTGIVTLSTTVSAPTGDRWTLPTPTARGAQFGRTFVAVAVDVPFAAGQGGGVGVEPDPAWRSWLAGSLGGNFGEIVPVPLEECTLTRRVEDDGRTEAALLRTETVVFSNPDGPSDIRTSVTLASRERELDLEFFVPPGVELLSAEFNRQTVEPDRTDSGTLSFRIVADEPIGLSRLVVNWRSSPSTERGHVREPLPGPILPSERQVLLVVPPEGQQYVVRDGITSMDDAEYHFRQTEDLCDILKSSGDGPSELPSERTNLAAELRWHLDALEQEPLSPEQAGRVAALRREYSEIREAMEDDVHGATGEAVVGPLPFDLWGMTSARFVGPGLLAGTPDAAASTLEFVAVSRALMRGITAAAICSGLLAALALLHRLVPAAWLRFLVERDSLLGLALLGLLWWALLPLGLAGLGIAAAAILWEAADVFRARNRFRQPV